ncbi:HPr-like protein Crh [Lysinibacillus alkalisoli]|uniref:HPr-like protein Crh n=1 Tax=Lysinibacillus alkalisoli TaxID=1911548 RepID=A0A917G5C5_9BACI|nr:HPr family phosphocarrier protein [Lysinibacillus alkalisoli]GGG23650.1 HPr-like protein Crh [Lysinibacillus alkalisoli]
MYEKQVQVKLKLGLQARQAAHFVQEANRFRSEVYLEKEGKRVNAKSIMGVMSLAIAKNTTITLAADGDDEQAAVEALTALIVVE